MRPARRKRSFATEHRLRRLTSEPPQPPRSPASLPTARGRPGGHYGRFPSRGAQSCGSRDTSAQGGKPARSASSCGSRVQPTHAHFKGVLMATATSSVVLEPAAKELTTATAQHPFSSARPGGRPQSARRPAVVPGERGRDRRGVDHRRRRANGGGEGADRQAASATGTFPVVVYIHGAGWVFGDENTHDRLVRELSVGAGAAVCSPCSTGRPRRNTPSRSSRTTPWVSGRQKRQRNVSTAYEWRCAATPSAAIWRPRSLMAKDRGEPRFRPGAVVPGHQRRLQHGFLCAVRRGLLPDP